jgi:hypothetical protein
MTNFAKQLTIIPNPEETIAVIKNLICYRIGDVVAVFCS